VVKNKVTIANFCFLFVIDLTVSTNDVKPQRYRRHALCHTGGELSDLSLYVD
jgi:hypothetical protein